MSRATAMGLTHYTDEEDAIFRENSDLDDEALADLLVKHGFPKRSKASIYQHRNRLMLPRRRRITDKSKVMTMARNGSTMQEIADEFNVSPSMVRHFCHINGIKLCDVRYRGDNKHGFSNDE